MNKKNQQNGIPNWPLPFSVSDSMPKIPKWIKEQFGMNPSKVVNYEDEQFIYRVMVEVLKYPDKKLSDLHRDANRLGQFDLKSKRQKDKTAKNKNQTKGKKYKPELQNSRQNIFTQEGLIEEQSEKTEKIEASHCQCCGLLVQQQTISICEPFEEFPIIGLSTYLYFRTLINVVILLVFLLVIYSLFSVGINYYIFTKGSGKTLVDGLSLIPANYITIFSYKSIEKYYATFEDDITLMTRIGAILIMIVIIIWSLVVYLFKHLEVQYEQLIDDESITASDFSVMIQKAPLQLFKDLNFVSRQFQQYFSNIFPIIKKQYFQKHLKTEYGKSFLSSDQQLKKLKLKKINIGIPFYLNESNLEDDDEYQNLQKQLVEHKEVLIEWIQQFFEKEKLTVKVQRRQKRLEQYQEVQKKLIEKKQNFKKSLQKVYKLSSNGEMKTTVFLTFECAIAAKIVYELNPHSFTQKVRYFLSCCNSQKMLQIKDKKGKTLDLIISRAPQPEDIIWQNVGYSFCKIFMRRCLTYLITIAILTGSFFLITFLSEIQLKSHNSLISIVISLSLSIINVVIGCTYFQLFQILEKDFTKTNYQASLSLKSVFARIVNSIAIPVMVKQNNIYGASGLVEDVFFLAITTAFVDPLLKFLNINYFINRAKYWFKSGNCNFISMLDRRLGIDQDELNSYAALMQFQAGFQYIYIVNLFLICCFFTPLQPIIPIFSIIGLLLMYWASKNTLLNYMKRPMPGSDMINQTLGSVITLGPIMLATGATIFSDILSEHGDRNLKFLLHLIALGIGGFFYLLPFKAIYRIVFFQDEKFINLTYFENRILLTSEYDRMNPATSDLAIQDFMNYLQQINNILEDKYPNANQNSQNRDKQKILGSLAKMAKKANQNPQSKQAQNLKNMGFDLKTNNIVKNLFSGQNNKPVQSLPLKILNQKETQNQVSKPENMVKNRNQLKQSGQNKKTHQARNKESNNVGFLRQGRKNVNPLINNSIETEKLSYQPFVKQIQEFSYDIEQKQDKEFRKDKHFKKQQHKNSNQQKGKNGQKKHKLKSQPNQRNYNEQQKFEEKNDQGKQVSPLKRDLKQQKFNLEKLKKFKVKDNRQQPQPINNQLIQKGKLKQKKQNKKSHSKNIEHKINRQITQQASLDDPNHKKPIQLDNRSKKLYVTPQSNRNEFSPQKIQFPRTSQNDRDKNHNRRKSTPFLGEQQYHKSPLKQNFNQKINDNNNSNQFAENQLVFNGYSIDYQNERRKNRNNPYSQINNKMSL